MSAIWDREQRDQICDTRRGARPNLATVKVETNDEYVRWWIETYGSEALAIARDFLRGGGLGQ